MDNETLSSATSADSESSNVLSNNNNNNHCYLTTEIILFSLNLAVFAVQLPLSLYNFLFVYRTALLHPNLRNILIAQCACFCLFGLAHTVQICIILCIIGHQEDNNAPQAVIERLIEAKEHTHPIILLTGQFGNLIGHVLVLERMLATVLAKNYENWRKPYFTIAWFLPMTIFSVYSCLQQIMMHSDLDNPVSVFHLTAGNVISIYLSLTLSLAEIIVAFTVLSARNMQRYKNWMYNAHSAQHNLSERYQLAENVRTARQLSPTVSLHFLNTAVLSVLPILLSYKLLSDDALMDVLMIGTLLVQSICNGLIEYTLISRHPILRRNALEYLQRLRHQIRTCLCPPYRHHSNRVAADKSMATISHSGGGDASNNNGAQQMRTLELVGMTNLEIRPANMEIDRHFLMLKQQWE